MKAKKRHGQDLLLLDRAFAMAAQTAAQGARGQLIRANTDDGPRRQPPAKNSNEVEEENWELRHGWEDQYNSNEYLSLLSSVSIHPP